MPAGSCILFLGTLWHGAGENRTAADRLAITAQYCEPWLRTQENYFLSVSRETAASVSENIRRMLGYSIHPPFAGMSDGMHPKRKLPGGGS
jgi:ectoine hydroxylase-related dioxygenase (phytanoyl-CoA dioxygenase family)